MPANTPLYRAHDIAQQLQDRIEELPRVERAFVHVDHESTHRPVSIMYLLGSSLIHYRNIGKRNKI